MGEKRKTYSKDFKIMVVEDYLSGKNGGICQIAKKYNIPKEYMITLCTRKYNDNGVESLGENRGKAKGKRKGSQKRNI